VNTAAEGLPGIVRIPGVEPGTAKDAILKRVWIEINDTLKASSSKTAHKVIEAYKLVSKGSSLCVIVRADHRSFKEEPAALIAAARTLTEDYQLNVLIDACEGAVPDTLSHGEVRLEMEPMSDAVMKKLPQFTELFKYLNDTNNEQVVLSVCNGCPALLEELVVRLEKCSVNDKDTQVCDFVENILINALSRICELKKAYPEINEVWERRSKF
jgi:hypothetical protein